MRKFERIALLFTMIVTALAFTWGDTLTESLQEISLFGEQSITPATPVTGQNKLYFKTDGQLYVLDDTGSESLVGGSGAGGSGLNLITDPSFEKDVSEGVCTTCTASQETTACLLTDTNAACLKMSFSASAGDYQDVTATTDSFDNIIVSGTGIYDGTYALAFRPGSLLNDDSISVSTARRFNIFHLDAGGGTWYAIIAYDALVSDAQNTVKYVITSDTSDFSGFANGGSYPTLVDLGVIGSSSRATSGTQYGVFDSPSVAGTNKLNYISEYTNTEGQITAYCKTSASDVELCSLVDGSESVCTAIDSTDEWKKYSFLDTAGSASFGYKIVARSSITDDVFCDEVYAGSKPIGTVATQPVYAFTSSSAVVNNTENTTATFVAFDTSFTTNATSNPVEITLTGTLTAQTIMNPAAEADVNIGCALRVRRSAALVATNYVRFLGRSRTDGFATQNGSFGTMLDTTASASTTYTYTVEIVNENSPGFTETIKGCDWNSDGGNVAIILKQAN